jgi:hypothetical protein
MPELVVKDVYDVLGMDPVRRVWTVRSSHNALEEAQDAAEALQHKKPTLRVRVVPGQTVMVQPDPPIVNQTRQFRQEQAGRMIELADAKKRYKSPG